MKDYESTAPRKYKAGIDPEQEHTIQQAQEVVANAIQKHTENDSEGLWRKVNDAFLKLGNNKDSITSWLGLLPGERQYMSVVCGGFKIILKVWLCPSSSLCNHFTDWYAGREPLQQDPQRHPRRSLEDPHPPHHRRAHFTHFPKLERLHSLSKSFYASILSALGHILHYLS